MWQSIRENPRAVTYAVLMHLVLLALLAVGLDWTPKAIKPGVKIPSEAELDSNDELTPIEDRELDEKGEAEKRRPREDEARKK